MKVSYSGGEREVNIGDKFTLYYPNNSRWEIVDVRTSGMYSPSGFGGTFGFGCKLIDGELPESWKKYVEPDGCVIICGDSIAASMAREERTAVGKTASNEE